MTDSKNDQAWQSLFDKYGILKQIEHNGQFIITSTQINEFREARLMTKFDYKSQLPALFSQNHLSILPVSRGGYIIADFEAFENFDDPQSGDNPVEIVRFPAHIESIDYNNITSEATALNCAYVSGILATFIEDETIRPTVNGRMSSLSFDFNINSRGSLLKVTVENSQLEIDGGYEGQGTLSLIEAKNSLSKDFIIRQLYYPYRLWSAKIRKKIKPLFLTYTNGTFHLREYGFGDLKNYNSIRLLKQKKYTIGEHAINAESIQSLLDTIAVAEEPATIPFPQADSFARVINLCELLNENTVLSKDEITKRYDFDDRQTNYYSDAGRYLGLIEKRKEKGRIIFALTAKGNGLFKIQINKRQLEFVKLMLSHLAFKMTLTLYFEKARKPSKEEIVAIMKRSNLQGVGSDETYRRRASTVSSWTNWILALLDFSPY